MKSLFFLFITLTFYSKIDAQTLDEKYLIASIHLRSNEELNIELREFFINYLGNTNNFIQFRTTSRVENLKPLNIESLVQYDSLLNEQFYLPYLSNQSKPFDNNLLTNVVSIPSAKIYLIFSTPIKNYLLAELRPITDTEIIFSNTKQPERVAQLLFIFNTHGLVEDVLTFYQINK